MITSIKNKVDFKDSEELSSLQSQIKQTRLEDRLRKLGFHYDAKQLLEPITKTLTSTNQNLLDETRFNTKAIEKLGESNVFVKASELKFKSGVTHTSLIRPKTKPLVPEKNVNFDYMIILIVIVVKIT